MRAAFLASALALAACGGEAERETAAPSTTDTATPVAAQPEQMSSASPDPDNAPAIPARFVGVWDAETGTCDPASDLRLDITPQAIGFYESHGTVTAVTGSGDGPIVVALAMEGEGDRWEQTIKLELVETGGTEWLLSLPGPDSDVMVRPIRLKRCPA